MIGTGTTNCVLFPKTFKTHSCSGDSSSVQPPVRGHTFLRRMLPERSTKAWNK